MTVGAGGTGVSGAAGNGGGTSSFGSLLTAGGGTGGGSGTTGSGPRGGTGGSSASNADLVVPGDNGTTGIPTVLAGTGGGSFLGRGGRAPTNSDTGGGTGGFVYGGGGAGLIGTASTLAGQDGAAGVVIVELYA